MMMVLQHKLVAFAALGVSLLLDQTARVEACNCLEPAPSMCDLFHQSFAVAHVTTSERRENNERTSPYDVTYVVEMKTRYKGFENVQNLGPLEFNTCDEEGCCGAELADGADYLLGLDADDGHLVAYSCGLIVEWGNVTPEELTELEGGCMSEVDESPTDGTGTTTEEEYEEDSPTEGCTPECLDFQECLVYAEDGADDVHYCADTCAPGTCGDEETCSLEDVECVMAPCSPVAVCTATPLPTLPQTPPVIAGYVGCFRDTRNDRVLGLKYDSPSMTTELCVAHCEGEGAAYAATQYGYECWCYRTGRTDFDRHGSDETDDEVKCDSPCAGDKDEICGGSWAFSLYKLNWPQAPKDNPEWVDCYRDTRGMRVMGDMVTRRDMTPAICRDHCEAKEAKYYATQYGVECWCGTSNSISDYNTHGEGVCHLPCAGDEDISCGGVYAFDLFKFKDDL